MVWLLLLFSQIFYKLKEENINYIILFSLIFLPGLDEALPFVVEGQQVGLIKENVKSVLLLKYPEVFCLRDYHDTKKVSLCYFYLLRVTSLILCSSW